MESNATALPVVGSMSRRKPFLEPLAFSLLEEIRAFFQDPANEAEFQAWQAEQNRGGLDGGAAGI